MADFTIKPGAAIPWGILTVIHGDLSSLNDLVTASEARQWCLLLCNIDMIVCGGLLSHNN